MATIKEISKLANVSITTVSRVLNQDGTIVVSPEVKQRILKIARELKYVPPRLRHAQNEREIVIGIADWHIIREDRPNKSIDSLDRIAENVAAQAAIRFERMEEHGGGQYDGVIAFGDFTEEEMEKLQIRSGSVVFINSAKRDYEYDCIVMDFNIGIYEMLDYLMVKKQYRSIGYIGGVIDKDGLRIGFHRLNGFRETLRQRGYYKEESFFIGEISRESGYELARQAIASGHMPEAVLLGNEEVAEGVLEAFAEEGVRVPKDVAVVIYKDIETLESKWPTYTRVRMFPEIVWQTAVKLLLEQILGDRKENMTIFLPTRLEVGDSA